MLEYFVVAFAVLILFIYLTADHFINMNNWSGTWRDINGKIYIFEQSGNNINIISEDINMTGTVKGTTLFINNSDLYMKLGGLTRRNITVLRGNSINILNKMVKI
jgi:hypothetical protein